MLDLQQLLFLFFLFFLFPPGLLGGLGGKRERERVKVRESKKMPGPFKAVRKGRVRT